MVGMYVIFTSKLYKLLSTGAPLGYLGVSPVGGRICFWGSVEGGAFGFALRRS